MQEPPRQINVTYEILASLRRQEDSLARIRQLLTTIQAMLILILLFGGMAFLSAVVLRR